MGKIGRGGYLAGGQVSSKATNICVYSFSPNPNNQRIVGIHSLHYDVGLKELEILKVYLRN